MNKVGIASAPGKIVLSGEYAVLDGAPAICMAIDRRARARVLDIDEAESSVTASGYTEEVGRFEMSHDGIHWRNGADKFKLVDAVLRTLEQKSPVAVDLKTTDFIDADSGEKIGIGSSAALTVALCAATKQSEDVATLARLAHTKMQDGAGSGVDIACSVNGGLIKYQMAGANVTPLKWPNGLLYRVIWSGISASTQDKLAALSSRVSKPSRIRLTVAAEHLASAWCDGDTAGILSQYCDYLECLRGFDVDHELDIFGAGHGELSDAATAANLTYKPCGAGGGDVGILLGTDSALLEAFTRNLTPNFSVLDCELDSDGVRLEGRNEA